MYNFHYIFLNNFLSVYKMLKNKVLFAGWGAENPSDFYAYQMWGYLLKKIFPNMISFDTKENYFKYGKKDMNNNFL